MDEWCREIITRQWRVVNSQHWWEEHHEGCECVDGQCTGYGPCRCEDCEEDDEEDEPDDR